VFDRITTFLKDCRWLLLLHLAFAVIVLCIFDISMKIMISLHTYINYVCA